MSSRIRRNYWRAGKRSSDESSAGDAVRDTNVESHFLDMTKPLVTIAIPTYNRGGSYLREAILAALGQTYEHIEVLVADNCSTDNTPEIVYGVTDPKLTYFRHDKNIGANNNANFLLSKAAGQYFLVCNDDDLIDADFVAVCVEAAKSRPMPGLITTGSRVINGKGDVLRQKESDGSASSIEDLILLWYQRRIHLFLCSSLFRTQVLREAGGFEVRYGHFCDVAAEFKCASRSGCIGIPAVKSSLRVHPTTITRSADIGAWCDSSLALLDLAISLAITRRQEIAAVAYPVSAARNYTLADDLSSLGKRWKAYFTVLRRFGYRYWPERQAIKSLALLSVRALCATGRQTAD